ncbi:Nuclear hormone receptor hr38 [Camponotus japonicus]
MLTTVEDSTGNAEATAAAVGVAAHHHHHHHHHQHQQHRGTIAVARHLGVEQQQSERSAAAPIHLTTPYHQVTIAADTNNNHDHHRNLEHHAAQRHDHWNKCKSDKRNARSRADYP